MNWSQTQEPNPQIPYDHVLLNSPLGIMIIEWKSWKENPDYDLYLNGNLLYCAGSLESAKEFAKEYLTRLRDELDKFLVDVKQVEA